MFYLTTHTTHFIYGYMALRLRTILIVRKETRGALAGTKNSSMGPPETFQRTTVRTTHVVDHKIISIYFIKTNMDIVNIVAMLPSFLIMRQP